MNKILNRFKGYTSLSQLAEKGLPLTLESLHAYREAIVWMISVAGPTDRAQLVLDIVLGIAVYRDRAPWQKHHLCVEFRRAGSQTAISVGTLRGSDPCWEFCEVMPLQISFVSISMATRDLEMHPPRGLRIERTVTPANESTGTKPTVRLACIPIAVEARRSDPELAHGATIEAMQSVRGTDLPVHPAPTPPDAALARQRLGTIAPKVAVAPRPTTKPGAPGPSIPHGRIVRARTMIGIPGVDPGSAPTPPPVRQVPVRMPSPIPQVREEYAPGSIRGTPIVPLAPSTKGPTVMGATFTSHELPPLPQDRPIPVTGVPLRSSSSPPPPLASSEPPPPVSSDPPEAYLVSRRPPTTEEHPSSPHN